MNVSHFTVYNRLAPPANGDTGKIRLASFSWYSDAYHYLRDSLDATKAESSFLLNEASHVYGSGKSGFVTLESGNVVEVSYSF